MINGLRALVSATVEVDDGTRISYQVSGTGLVEFLIGNHEFYLFATEGGLGKLVDRFQEALREVHIAIARNAESRAPE